MDEEFTSGFTKGIASHLIRLNTDDDYFDEVMGDKPSFYEEYRDNFDVRFDLKKWSYEQEHGIKFEDHPDEYIRFYEQQKEMFDREKELYRKINEDKEK